MILAPRYFFPILLTISCCFSFRQISYRIKYSLLSSSQTNDPFDFFSNDNDEDVYYPENSYCAAMGLESIVTSIGDSRSMIPIEYELAFQLFPGLRQAAVDGIWPLRKDLKKEEKEIMKLSFDPSFYSTTEADIDVELKRFRQTILGLEKYRINNPGDVAKKYQKLLRICLNSREYWGAGANALEYAGLMIKDHVADNCVQFPEEGEETLNFKLEGKKGIPCLLLSSLWNQALVRLLDLEEKNEKERTQENGNTWDQKYFSQINLSNEGKLEIKQMLTRIAQLSLRAIFSNENNNLILVQFPDFPDLSRNEETMIDMFKPSGFILKLVLETEGKIVKEYDPVNKDFQKENKNLSDKYSSDKNSFFLIRRKY